MLKTEPFITSIQNSLFEYGYIIREEFLNRDDLVNLGYEEEYNRYVGKEKIYKFTGKNNELILITRFFICIYLDYTVAHSLTQHILLMDELIKLIKDDEIKESKFIIIESLVLTKDNSLIFCVSREHARFMKDYFNERNIPSINLDSNSSNEERNSAKEKLTKGEIKFIFVVDLYNEGVNIPKVNTIMFLRPTESATIFIQQLGRGLRIDEDKDVLTVLDFVGQASKQFDYRNRLRSIIGKTNNSVEDEINNGFPILPTGCFIQLERKAGEYILKNLKSTYANKNNLRKMIRNYSFEIDQPLNLNNFLNHYKLENTDQVLAAFEEHTVDKKKSFREGVLYVKSKDTDVFFITLNKSEKHFSVTTQYDDYAINERLFHWQSQSRTSDLSPTGQRYINQRKNGNKILLFIREFRSENNITSPFYFLGKANYVSHKGSKPISITWEMEKPIPAFLLKKSNNMVAL